MDPGKRVTPTNSYYWSQPLPLLHPLAQLSMPRHLLLLLLLISAPATPAQELLTKVDQVRALTPEQAGARIPVKLDGLITFFDSKRGQAFIQDETGTLFFRPSPEPVPKVGDRVEITGTTWGGSFSPSVTGVVDGNASKPIGVNLRLLGENEQPEAISVPFDQLRTGRWHDQLVSLRATIRRITTADDEMEILLSGPDGRTIRARLFHTDSDQMPGLVDQEISLRAMVAGGGDSTGQLQEAYLIIGDDSWLDPEPGRMRDAFSQPPLALDQLRRYQPPNQRINRSRIDGTVSLVVPDQGFYLSSGGLGTWIETPQRTSFHVGDVVSVVGYLTGDGVSDGIVKVLANGSPPAPRIIRTAELSEPINQGALVTIDGALKEIHRSAKSADIKIEDTTGNSSWARAGQLPEGLRSGARLALTGVVKDGALLLRNAADVAVIQDAPWLTPIRRNLFIGGTVAAVALTALWVILLKRQVMRQTRLIESQLVHKTLVEERQRMSRELHDSLEQHLAGLHIQLSTLRDRIADGPENVRRIAASASRMLDHCRDEARRSVFELRTQTLQRSGLAAALVQIADEASPDGGPQIVAEISGQSERLDPAVEFHLLRCVQEAIGNALKHAQAQEILVHLCYLPGEAVLSVRDDGCGFDPDSPPQRGRPSFGLLHLKERAARINAILSIKSAPDRGTEITLTLPTG